MARTGSGRRDEWCAFAEEGGLGIDDEDAHEVCAEVGYEDELGGWVEDRFVCVRG